MPLLRELLIITKILGPVALITSLRNLVRKKSSLQCPYWFVKFGTGFFFFALYWLALFLK